MSMDIRFLKYVFQKISTVFLKNNILHYNKKFISFLTSAMKKNNVSVVGFAIIQNYEVISADT